MCGLAGVWGEATEDPQRLSREVGAMADALAHRGPDDRGVWVSDVDGFGVGFRRLAILDLSPTGHQPMISADERYVVAFNGEIYNFRDLRLELEAAGARFRGSSDTEVLLWGAMTWGVPRMVRALWGMFAIALWDRAERRLTLARDRLGKKPLYYGSVAGRWLFASELKALRAVAPDALDVDPAAVAAYAQFGYVPSPLTIYRHVHKLPPATMLVRERDGRTNLERYWDVSAVAAAGSAAPLAIDADTAVRELEHRLGDAVERRMIADVPLGAFLSGGVDSSVVVALMRARAGQAVRTFTLGFDVPGYDEAKDARKVATHLQTQHHELYVTPTEAMDVVPRLPEIYDEPFADSSQIPTFLVSQLARHQVTVALTGDGGDEVFGGYTRYVWADDIWRRASATPAVLRRLLAASVRAVPPAWLDRAYGAVGPILPRRARQSEPAEKLRKLADVLSATTREDVYRTLVSHWRSEDGVTGAIGPGDFGPTASPLPSFPSEMMRLDQLTYLPDDILVKVDRASMAVSLEVRSPLLDHRLIEWAWSLPLDFKIRDGRNKWLLRELAAKLLPRELLERPKAGFALPLGAWLRGPLRPWAEALLDERRLAQDGWFQATPVRAAWQRHLEGRTNEQHRLWIVLMFQAWLERVRHPEPVAVAACAPAAGAQARHA